MAGFQTIYESDNRKFCLTLNIKCTGKKTLRAFASDYGKPNSFYADRDIQVEGSRSIYFSFPVSPKKLQIVVVNRENPNDNDIEVMLIESQLKTYNIHIDSQTKRFLDLAIPFCQIAGFTGPHIYKKDEFTIRYSEVIRDFLSGQPLKTPARVGHQTGAIDVAKVSFDKYTIPMRLIIILHEFGHKYANPKGGWEISDEVGADINALYYYLGLGFSKIDAIYVFANIFYGAQTELNQKRMRTLINYVNSFEQGQFAEKNF